MKLPGRDETSADVLQLVCEWLSRGSRGRWLLILDNADDPIVFEDSPKKGLALEARSPDDLSPPLSKFVPQTRNGHILITSRSKMIAQRLTGDTTSVLMVDPMPLQAARTLLHTKLAGNWDAEDIDQLLQALDFIPLAFMQAAAFINENTPRLTVRKYLQLLRGGDAPAKLLYKDTGDLRRDPSAASSIGNVFQRSFDRIREIAPSAARLLSLISFFHPDGIQDYLLVQYNNDKLTGLDHRDESNPQFEEDISTLRDYFLITTNGEGDLFRTHRLVQHFMKGWLKRNGELEKWKGRYLMILSQAFPKDPYEHWAKCRALFPHAEVAINYQPVDHEYLAFYTTVLGNASLYAEATGSYEVAEKMSRSAHGCCETLLGQHNPLTLTCTQNLALIFRHQGKYKEAEDMIQSVYEKRKEIFGPDHPDTLASASILASVYRLQGRLPQSHNFSQQVLEGCQRMLGPEHPHTLSIMSNLAATYCALGEEEKGLDIQERVLKSRQRILGLEHPDTLSAMADLAETFVARGMRVEAEKLEMQVVEKRIEILGSEHPDTLSAIDKLAATLSTQGWRYEAEGFEMQVAKKRTEILGSEHPKAPPAIVSLVATLLALDRNGEAENLRLLALNNTIKVRRNEDPARVVAMSNLGSNYVATGDYRRAEELLLRALALSQRRFEEEHSATLLEMGNLAASYSASGRKQAAQKLLMEVLKLRMKVFGEQHPQTQLARDQLHELNQVILREQ